MKTAKHHAFSMPDDLFEAFSHACKERCMNQSAVIRGLIGAQLRAWEGGALGHLGLTLKDTVAVTPPSATPLLPDVPQQAPSKPRRPKERPISPAAAEVLAYLREVTGRDFREVGEIEHRLSDPMNPATVAACKLVIDWLHQERRRRDADWVERYLDHTTPFRKANFDKYLAQAKAWKQRQQTYNRPTGRAYMHA